VSTEHVRERVRTPGAAAGPQPEGAAPSNTGRRPEQLPTGRHGLPSSFVAANQRERIIAAVAPVVASVGYADMNVEAIVTRAGVSRRTFYEHFKNKEDAFLAAYAAAAWQRARHLRRAYFLEPTAQDRLRAGIRAYLEFTANDPDIARMCIVEVLAAGPRAMAKRYEAMQVFAEIIEDHLHELLADRRRAALTAETIVGGIHEVVFRRIIANRTDELPALAEDLWATILMLAPGRTH
jgi:AcrR family transcriptional regulator